MNGMALLVDVAEPEPGRLWFGGGGCVEEHDDGTFAAFMRGELLGMYSAEDVATRDVLIAVVRDRDGREDLARAFRVSPATVGRVITRYNSGGLRAVADYGRRGGWTVRTASLEKRLAELFEKGLGPRGAHRDVAKKASYGTVYAIYREWRAGRAAGEVTAEGEARRELARLEPQDPARERFEQEIRTSLERQRELMALRATAPVTAAVKDTPLAGKLCRHDLGYKNVLDTLRVAMANLESELAVSLARHLDRPREAKKVLATLFAAPGTVSLSSRLVTIRLMPAASEPERIAIAAFLRDITKLKLVLPGDPDHRRLQWALR